MIQAHRLAKWYASRCIFKGATFHAHAGTLLHVRGPNGCGKSTLLQILAGALPPTTGTYYAASATHFMNHQTAIKDHLSIADHLRFWSRLLGAPAGLPLDKIAERWGLPPCGEMPVGHLSLGQRKRLQLCQLSLTSAPVWLLDEPHHGLDAAGLQLLQSHIAAHLRQKGAVVLAHHGHFDVLPGETLTLAGCAV